MRSVAFTLLLAALAAAACAVATWQWQGRNFDAWFGPPPVPVGKRIYDSFSPPEVRRIQVSHNRKTAIFKLGENGWEGVSPWKDRVDPRKAVGIIQFALGMRVEDFADADSIDPQTAGLGDSRIDIRLGDADNRQLARFKVGRQTPWLATFPDIEQPVPTVFVQRRDENQKHYIYACTGDISDYFKDGMARLRDHHPFYFNPLALKSIQIRTADAELTLAREHPGRPEIPATATTPAIPAIPPAPWRIVRPLELPTDKLAMKALLEGLYQLEASQVSDRPPGPLPATGSQTRNSQIAITAFGSDTPVVLEILPPENPAATTVRAFVSDRPNTAFELPLKPEGDRVTLATLPLAVNDLRDAMLTNIQRENLELLRRIVIQPASAPGIVLTRTPPQRWMVDRGEGPEEANEERLFTLLKAVTESRVSGFESDAATDFSPWGLDRPMLGLSFETEDPAQAIRLHFGTDGKGNYFVNRQGSPTVMRVDSTLVSQLPMRAFEWRQSRLWSVDRVNLRELLRRTGGDPVLELTYDFNQEQWTGKQGDRDVTASINAAHANYLLGVLEGLKASRWLSPDDNAAAKALETPSLVFRIVEDTTDDLGDVTGQVVRDLSLAPPPAAPNPAFYYGRLVGDEQPFMLDRETYLKLTGSLLD